MTLDYSKFDFHFFKIPLLRFEYNARCFLNTLHVGLSINCRRKRNTRRIQSWGRIRSYRRWKRVGGGRETWPNKMSDRDPTNEKKGQHAWREYRKRRIEWHWSVDCSNVCEEFYLFDHNRHVVLFHTLELVFLFWE